MTHPLRTAWVAGATGLIGQALLEQLCAHNAFDRVVGFTRRPVGEDAYRHRKLDWHLCDFETLAAPSPPAVNHLFCALGSTKRKTPDAATYYRIDVSYPLLFARLGLAHGATSFALVSAHGANTSSFSSYLKMKGQAEADVCALGYEHTVIARPSLLLGDRGEFRLAEKLSESFMRWAPGNYKAIAADDVAASMIATSLSASAAVSVLNSSAMQGAQHA